MELPEPVHPCRSPGFTLLELLVAVAIIAVVASLAIVALNELRTLAQISKTQADLQQIAISIDTIREKKNKALVDITINSCSDCGGCRVSWRQTYGYNPDLRNIPDTDPCITAMNATFQEIGYAGIFRDPWGSPYLIDENENEGGICNDRHDQIYSAGPDGLNYGEGEGADDIQVIIPHYFCP